MDTPLAVLVVALAPQSGKSTVAALAAERLGTEWRASSAPVVERLEAELGLAPGTIAAERALDHDRYRAELVALGDEMAGRGELPGVLCIEAGFRVVDGIRRAHELEATRAAARERGWRPLVLCVERPGQELTDNTEADALRRAADLVIVNDGSLEELRRRVDAALGIDAR
jgi:hypothetical protein